MVILPKYGFTVVLYFSAKCSFRKRKELPVSVSAFSSTTFINALVLVFSRYSSIVEAETKSNVEAVAFGEGRLDLDLHICW